MTKLDAPTRWALWTLLLIVPFYSLAAHFGYDDRGFAAGLFMASVGFAARAHWNSRRHVAYWIAVVVLVVVHIFLVILLPWPTWKLSGAAFMSMIGFPDFLVNFAVIRLFLVGINRHAREASAS
jgi:hypothetical protein